MSLIQMTIKHNRTHDEARRVLEQSVREVRAQFAVMIDTCQWSDDRNTVFLSGSGCTCEIRVDPVEVHVRGDIPFLSGLLAGPFAAGFKQILQRNFQALPAPRP
jgi:putative polyhydroxyalkanoic acid system protein